jgi:hypothetical protein
MRCDPPVATSAVIKIDNQTKSNVTQHVAQLSLETYALDPNGEMGQQ